MKKAIEFIYGLYEFFETLLFLIGNFIWCIFVLDFYNAQDTLYWILIHSTYKGECVSHPPFKQRIKSFPKAFIGFAFVSLLLYSIYFIIDQIIFSFS